MLVLPVPTPIPREVVSGRIVKSLPLSFAESIWPLLRLTVSAISSMLPVANEPPITFAPVEDSIPLLPSRPVPVISIVAAPVDSIFDPPLSETPDCTPPELPPVPATEIDPVEEVRMLVLESSNPRAAVEPPGFPPFAMIERLPAPTLISAPFSETPV